MGDLSDRPSKKYVLEELSLQKRIVYIKRAVMKTNLLTSLVIPPPKKKISMQVGPLWVPHYVQAVRSRDVGKEVSLSII